MKIKELIVECESITLWFRLSEIEDNLILSEIISSLYSSSFCREALFKCDYPIKKDITLIITPDRIIIKKRSRT